ncbi:AAA family ATPase [Streptomyces sp. NBC_01716]|uniref:AAA family ATPase n=1 Tax=Streptomyces sp. NBC_01716 TaxID=2975917 RepID=UPI002E2FEFF5|nr:AAA family ATPase [Streptomyces sp. NBC_01716]
MIVWVNGSFGAGKTTLVAELSSRWPDALVYDPEQVGLVLRDIVDVPTGDFQDLPLWRSQLVSLALGLLKEYERPVLVPMTLVHPLYVSEVFGALEAAGVTMHHFFLKVPADVLERRLRARVVTHGGGDPERDAAGLEWVMERMVRCVAAVDTMPTGTIFLDGERPTADLADDLLKRVGAEI